MRSADPAGGPPRRVPRFMLAGAVLGGVLIPQGTPSGIALAFDTSALAPGLYIVRAQSGAEVAVQRITVIR